MGAYYSHAAEPQQGERLAWTSKSAEGKAVFLDLVRRADVVFDNLQGRRQRSAWASTFESLSQVNPRIVTCSLSRASARPAPRRSARPSTSVVQAMGGGMSITGTPESGPAAQRHPDRRPRRRRCSARWAFWRRWPSANAPGAASTSTSRCSTPRSRCSTTWRLCTSMLWPRARGHRQRLLRARALQQPILPADGHIIIACIGDHFLRALRRASSTCRRCAAPSLPAAAGALGGQGRDRRADRRRVAQASRPPTGSNRLRCRPRIPWGPVNDFAQALGDTLVLARDMVVEVPLHTGDGPCDAGQPDQALGPPRPAYRQPAVAGERTRRVLGDWVGYLRRAAGRAARGRHHRLKMPTMEAHPHHRRRAARRPAETEAGAPGRQRCQAALVQLLAVAGVRSVEATSLVSPKAVPQMADAAELLPAGTRRCPSCRLLGAGAQLKGLERAHAAGVAEIASCSRPPRP